MSLRCWMIFLTILILSISMLMARSDGQDLSLASPRRATLGVVFTDEAGSALYLVSAGTVTRLLTARGCGVYYALSPDKKQLGVKIIGSDGLQRPAIVDIASGTVRLAAPGTRRAGQVSFSRNGVYGYTLDETFVLVGRTGETRFELGYYSNIAALSPGGDAVAFNDADDQIWILNLHTKRSRRVTDGRTGCFNPQWSPDGQMLLYSALGGSAYVFDQPRGVTSEMGEAHSPSWSEDGTLIVFYRTDVRDGVLVNSDIYCATPDGGSTRQLTATPGVKEFDPRLDDGRLLYHTGEDRTIWELPIAEPENHTEEQPFAVKVVSFAPVREAQTMPPSLQKHNAWSTLDIPYVHQCYDTPDWHNGNSSCAPTAAVMVLAYYNILPPWPSTCSTPYVHYNSWGSYVADKYYFRGVNYAAYQTTVYNAPVWGGFGYMWKTGSPQSRMAGYYNYHGMQSIQSFNTPHSVAVEEILAGRPFTMCTLLTTAGHLTIAHGFGAEIHTLIFNDPYGDKSRGYKNYYGKNVAYDWPGYNNGFPNLTEVAWCIATQYVPAAAADTLVDDLHFGRGFYLHTQAPATMTAWMDYTYGWEGHAWWTNSTVTDTCYAIWTPTLTRTGRYEVFAMIHLRGEAKARYKVSHDNGSSIVDVDQQAQQGNWVSLGEYSFAAGKAGSVRLGSGSPVSGKPMAFDAIRWSYRGTTLAEESSPWPSQFILLQNYPNPFNPSTTISYQISAAGFVTLKVSDLLGRDIRTLVQRAQSAGRHTVTFDASTLPAGVYFYSLEAGNVREVKRMTLIK